MLEALLTSDDRACMQALSDMLEYEFESSDESPPTTRSQYDARWAWYSGWMDPLP